MAEQINCVNCGGYQVPANHVCPPKRRPEWWPAWEPNKYPPFAFHVEVWDAGVEAGVKAVIERIRELGKRRVLRVDAETGELTDMGCPHMLLAHEWAEELSKEAGLE